MGIGLVRERLCCSRRRRTSGPFSSCLVTPSWSAQSVTSESRWTTHWRWRSRQRCSFAKFGATAGLGGRWPAISCVSAAGKEPVAIMGRNGATGHKRTVSPTLQIARKLPVALTARSGRRCQLTPCGWSVASGKRKVKVEPAPTSLLTQILPPCSSMNFREMASPSPVPSIF